ncbi:glycosyltransferase [Nocardioides ochotonae]|uniref:glycosyltransferase family 2 protein n=1 Tax=Nocardioides ochotonae TaxID=2685869 RepID=UPI00140E562F
MERPRDVISVVVPTVLRPEVRRAVSSVVAQDCDSVIEILVVVDAMEVPPSFVIETPQRTDRIVRVLATGGPYGAPAARNLGARQSTGDFVAFLDDDDEWLPVHLSEALRVLDADVGLAGTRVYQEVDGSVISQPVPSTVLAPNQKMGDYLFRARKPGFGRASMFTSTLVCKREVLAQVPWLEGLKRHQDWDWLLRVEEAGFKIAQSGAVTAIIHVGTSGSISASAAWTPSLAWIRDQADRLSGQAYVDFLTAQTLRYAIQARSFRGTQVVLREIRRCRQLPRIGPVVIAASGLFPRGRSMSVAKRVANLTRRTNGDR